MSFDTLLYITNRKDACMIRALGTVAILLPAAFGQTPAKAPEFEVADIKMSDGTRDAKVQFLPGGRVDLPRACSH
jgi:hypothetical protein